MNTKLIILIGLLWALVVKAQSLDTLKILTEAKRYEALGDSLRIISSKIIVQSQFKLAIKMYSAALEKYQEINDLRGEVSTLRWIAACYRHLGDYPKVLSVEEKKLRSARLHGNRDSECRSLHNLGDCYYELSDYPKALDFLGQSLKMRRELRDRQGEGDTKGAIGAVYAALGDFAKALEYHQQMLDISRELKNPWAEAQALEEIGNVYYKLGDYQRALDYYQQDLKLTLQLTVQDLHEGGTAWGKVGKAYYKLADYPKALDYLLLNLKYARRQEHREEESEALCDIGLTYTAMGKYSEGIENLQLALNLAQEIKSDQLIQDYYYALGECYSAQAQDSSAMRCYSGAIRAAERIRGKLEVEAHKSSFSAGVVPAYEAMVLALLRLNRAAEAYNYVERCRARSFLDLLGGGKIQIGKSRDEEFLKREQEYQREKQRIEEQITTAGKDSAKAAKWRGEFEEEWSSISALVEEKKQFEPELSSLVTVNPLTLKEVQQLLDDRSTVLEYFLTKKEVLIWLITRDKAEVFRAQISSDSLKNLVKGFRDAIVLVGYEDFLSRDLYKILISPVADRIRTKKLVIIPHNVLHYLPFQALQNEQGDYLVDCYQINYLPSASVLKYLQIKRRPKGEKLLALGNPATDREGYYQLPLAEQEVKEIAGFYPQNQVLIGKAATEDKFRELAPNYDILHLACHSELNSAYPLYSGLLLAPGVEQDGELDVHELFTMDLNAYLVVLSACQTGLGHLTNGDELVGLSRAFIYAGTPSVLSSLWMVEDESTAFLMKQFYQNLKMYDKAESLRRAQLTTREKYKNPYSWAGFVLVGDAQ